MHRESRATNEDDHDLAGDDDELNGDEEVIACDPFEDVQLIVQAPIVILIEDLHPHKRVEDDCLQLFLLAARLIGENRLPPEV